MKNFQHSTRTNPKIAVILFLICSTTVFFAFPAPAFAHKVSIFAWVEGDMVHTQSHFFGGKKIKNASIDISDTSGKRLIQGKTDHNGEFSFKAPQKTAMKIVVSAGMGHQATWYLKASDFEDSENNMLPTEPASLSAAKRSPAPVPLAESSSPLTRHPGLTPDEIREIVEKTLDKKLSPVLKMLSELRNREPSLRDILGGIGYIIGLVGLVAYMGSRRKKENLTK
jgi:nickel transport protein